MRNDLPIIIVVNGKADEIKVLSLFLNNLKLKSADDAKPRYINVTQWIEYAIK